MPPSMMVDNERYNSAVDATPMTAATIVTPDVNANRRWDKFEIVRFIAIGSENSPANAAAANLANCQRVQLFTGYADNQTGYNATSLTAQMRHTHEYPINVGEGGIATAHNGMRLAPITSLGRFRYILTSAPSRSIAGRNNLGAVAFTDYEAAVRQNSCFVDRYTQQLGVETRIPSGSLPIERVEMNWTGQGPYIQCEWAVLKRIEPVYSLFYPQFEFFRDNHFEYDDVSTVQSGSTYRYGALKLPDNFVETKRSISGIKINEVPSLMVVKAEIIEQDRHRFDWLDVKPYISSLVFKVNERIDLTSSVPAIIGYRWFVENTNTLMTFQEWQANNLWLISPQQLALDPQIFVESAARVNTVSVTATISRPKPYKNAKHHYRAADFWKLVDEGDDIVSPRFQMTLTLMHDNHSLAMNSRREVILRKNVITTPGPTGLDRVQLGKPVVGGLSMAPSSGVRAVGGTQANVGEAV